MSKEKLQKKTCKELRELAGSLNIVGRWNMTKEQLIVAILGAEVAEVGEDKDLSAKDEVKINNQKNVEVEDKVEKKSANVDIDMGQKMPYIESAEIGALVAFKLANGKVKSAKITKKSSANRKLKLETEYGAIYIASYDDVIWVRTGNRWPRGVYKLLKGLGENEIEKQEVKA